MVNQPPIRPEPIEFSSSTEPQRKWSVIHALTRADINGDRPATGITLRAMLPWMVAYDNNRYGRWLPDF